VPWQWRFVEGVAELKQDTAWSLPQGGEMPSNVSRNGLIVDGTATYLDQLANRYPIQIRVVCSGAGLRFSLDRLG